MAGDRYEQRFLKYLKQRNAENRARRAAEAATLRLTYPQAVHKAGPALFGTKWIGPPTEHEHVVKQFGAGHPEFEEIARRGRERELQLARTERWLLVNGVVEVVRGAKRVRKAALEAVLREVSSGPDSPAPASADAIQARPKPKRTAGAKRPKRELVAAFVASNYPHGRLPPLKNIAKELGISPRTVARALGRK
jgi:hypothetical protein